MATPGTWPPPSNCTSRIASMAWANVATNSPIASWLGRSRRNVCTIRGENCPIASWTTTIVIVSTRAASETIDVAIVPRIPKAASGPPVSHRGISSKSDRSIDPHGRRRQNHARQDAHDRDEPHSATKTRGTRHWPELPNWGNARRRAMESGRPKPTEWAFAWPLHSPLWRGRAASSGSRRPRLGSGPLHPRRGRMRTRPLPSPWLRAVSCICLEYWWAVPATRADNSLGAPGQRCWLSVGDRDMAPGHPGSHVRVRRCLARTLGQKGSRRHNASPAESWPSQLAADLSTPVRTAAVVGVILRSHVPETPWLEGVGRSSCAWRPCNAHAPLGWRRVG